MGAGGGGSAAHPQPAQPFHCPSPPVAPSGVDLNLNLGIAQDYSILNPGAFLAYAQLEWHGGLWDYRTNQGTQYDDFGNLNFGATAAAMGAPYYAVQNAAGLYDNSGRSEGTPFLKWPYGDDVTGALQVRAGYDYVSHHCGCEH
jgi:type VI secretion system secreted protein VgrG